MRVQQLLAQTAVDMSPAHSVFTALAQTVDDDYLYSTSAPGASLDQPIAGKLGICSNSWTDQQVSQIGGEHMSWWYNYFHWIPNASNIDFIDREGIEFVPMIDQNKVKMRKWKKCWLTGENRFGEKMKKCDVDTLIDEIAQTRDELGVDMRFLIGLNEPYDKNINLPDKWVEPRVAASLWGEYWIPIAEALDLRLVSPTSIMKPDKAVWMADFLKGCWEQRDKDVNPCKIDTIEVFNIHHYTCKYNDYMNAYDVDSTHKNSYYQFLIDALTDPEWEGHADRDWDEFIRARPIWVTETSCQSDKWPETIPQQEQCLRMTGQKGGKWGKGSIQALKELDNVHRVAPFVYYSAVEWDDEVMVNHDGEWLPTGRAILNDLDPELADCYGSPQELNE